MSAAMRMLPASPLLAVLVFAVPLSAQESPGSKSAALARELASALEAAKLTSLAAKDPSADDVFVGALYFPGLQLLAISAKYQAPALLEARLGKQEFRDTYIDLNSASDPASRVLVTDFGVDGLAVRPEGDRAPDSYDAAGKSTVFNRDWGRQNLSEEEYLKIFAEADERYARMLAALLGQLKGT